ncbi:MAG: CvpA family protein [Clostridia bacterium]|nr:CvpA family protein [Clostridia bacterium]
MKAGLIADIIVAVIIIINIAICTKFGFIRCVLKCFSTVLAFTIAMLSAVPIANFLDSKFGWYAAIDKWNIPFISEQTLLKLIVGIAVFVLVRLICIIIDKLLKNLKEKLHAINIIDRIFGSVFGIMAALVELSLVFMVINTFGWQSALSLTEDSGGYFAYRLFNFCRDYVFNLIGAVFAAASDAIPQF